VSAVDGRGRYKKISTALSCIAKRTKEGCDPDSEVGTVQNGRNEERAITLRKLKESGKRENCEKDFVSR